MSSRVALLGTGLLASWVMAGCPAAPDGSTTPPAPSSRPLPAPAATSSMAPAAAPSAHSPAPTGPAHLSDAERELGCQKMAAAGCQKSAKCWKKDLFDYNYDSVAHCETLETLECMDRLVPPGARMSSESLQACATARAAAACDDTVPACKLAGWRDDGASCSVGGQCKSFSCVDVGADGCGRCGARPVWKVGAACKHYCGAELGCVQNQCVTKVALGAACVDDECADNHVCVGGKCTRRAKLGQRCDLSNEVGPECEEGLMCPFRLGPMGQTLPSTCVTLRWAQLGEPCDAEDTLCHRGQCHEGVCTAKLGEGAACDHSDYKRLKCQDALKCVQNKCVWRASLTCGAKTPQ